MKQKLKIQGIVYEVSNALYKQIKEMKQKNLGEVRINAKTFKLSEIEVMDLNIVDELTDWSSLEQKDYKSYEDIPETEKVISDEKALDNLNRIKNDIRTKLKIRNANWKPIIKDQEEKVAVDDVWEHLKLSIKTLEFPVIDNFWKDDPSIAHHDEGKETHPVAYKTKIIDLGDKYDHHFWAEANYIYCAVCKKHIRKQIVIFNDYESECVVRNL